MSLWYFLYPRVRRGSKKNDIVEEVTHTHSRGLTQEEAELLVTKEQLDGDELEALVEAKTLKMVDFILMDVREQMEFNQAHIVGTDALVPTSNFYAGIEAFSDKKDTQIILYCLSGSRSYQVQQAMKSLGFNKVGNLSHGIYSFKGEMQPA